MQTVGIRSWKNLCAGLATISLCVFFLLGSAYYGLGTLSRMGPGYFPAALSIIGVGLGLIIVVSAFKQAEATEQSVLPRAMVFITASIILFALIVDRAGLIPAIIVTGTLSALGDLHTRLWEALALSCGLAFAIWLIFIVLLALPIPAITIL